MQDRIKQIRKNLGLTQAELGRRIGVKGNTVAGYESGIRFPSDAIIRSISREFGISEKWLKFGKGNMYADDAESELDALVLRYGLTDADRTLLKKYLSLDAKSRKAIMSFITNVADELNASDDDFWGIPDTAEELERICPPVKLNSEKHNAG